MSNCKFKDIVSALTPMYGCGEAKALARMVLEERYHLTMTDILLGREAQLTPPQQAQLRDIVARLSAGEPVQHILGYADFCGHRFRVTPDVLIPRPETEELVQWILTVERGIGGEVAILDLGTGSGCIALSLAHALPDTTVTAIDSSPAALTIARRNAVDLGLLPPSVTFLHADMLNTQDLVAQLSTQPPFDVIVSNPPYVRHSEATTIHDNVLRHEPSSALFVPDSDPLIFYRAIATIANALLQPHGAIFVELNSALAQDTQALFRTAGFRNTQLRRDQFGQWRMLRASR